MNDAKQIWLGLDIGGTKIAYVIIDSTSNTVIKSDTLATPDSYEGLIAAIFRKLFLSTEAEYATTLKVGMCYPGSVAPESGLIHNANLIYLNGTRFEEELSAQLNRTIATDNDANCFVLAEATDGAAADANVVFGATLGTGLGGGLAINKKIWHGRNKIAGEWGHIQLPWASAEELENTPCYCGLNGCLETFVSGPGIARDFERHAKVKVRPEAIVHMSRTGDHEASASLHRFEHRLARGLATMINFLDPDIIVLGGGLATLSQLYINVPAIWDEFVFSNQAITTKLVQSKHGPYAGARGAAYLCREDSNNTPHQSTQAH